MLSRIRTYVVQSSILNGMKMIKQTYRFIYRADSHDSPKFLFYHQKTDMSARHPTGTDLIHVKYSDVKYTQVTSSMKPRKKVHTENIARDTTEASTAGYLEMQNRQHRAMKNYQ